MRKCLNCCVCLTHRHKIKFCSNKCQADFQYKIYIENWKKDSKLCGRGISTKNISGYLRKYLFEKYNNQCSRCGWSEKHPITSRSPLEVHHVDSDPTNNSETNLILLCPNCHSLTANFRNLNKGNGRKWRRN